MLVGDRAVALERAQVGGCRPQRLAPVDRVALIADMAAIDSVGDFRDVFAHHLHIAAEAIAGQDQRPGSQSPPARHRAGSGGHRRWCRRARRTGRPPMPRSECRCRLRRSGLSTHPSDPHRCARAARAYGAPRGRERGSCRSVPDRLPLISVSQSMVGPETSQTRSTIAGSDSPFALAIRSSRICATGSITLFSACSRVPQAGIMPDESAVEPWGTASRSSTKTSRPASFRVIAATRPHAPAPMIRAGTVISKAAESAGIIAISCFQISIIGWFCMVYPWRAIARTPLIGHPAMN